MKFSDKIHKKNCNGIYGHKHIHKHIYKDVRKYHRYVRVMPVMFLFTNILLAYVVIKIAPVSGLLVALFGVLFLVVIKDIGTFIFGRRLAKRILKPIEQLKDLVEEISSGNYGKTIDEYPSNDIGILIRDFNLMSQKLKENEEIKQKYEENRKQFIADISHDLKTPITSILGHVIGIKEGVAFDEAKKDKYLDIIYNNAIYSNKLIEDLFLISQFDINKFEYSFVDTVVKFYFEDLFFEIKCELEEEGIELVYNLNVEESYIMAFDNKAIKKVIMNILSNSKKYSDVDELKIVANINHEDNGISVSIRDNGRGIDNLELDKIFDRFYRVDKARNSTTGGSGLGLSICKEIVLSHGGSIYAYSEKNQYTEIIFTLKKVGENNG